MTYSSSFTDAEWELLEPLVHSKHTRSPKWTKREMIDDMFWLAADVTYVLCTR